MVGRANSVDVARRSRDRAAPATKLLPLLLSVLLAACSNPAPPPVSQQTSDTPAVQTVAGQRWRIAIRDLAGADIGELELLLTDIPGQSCLGSQTGPPRLASVTRTTLDESKISLRGTGVSVWLEGEKMLVDLASPCDLYRLLDGKVSAGGLASGDLVSFGRTNREVIGRFTARRE